MTPEEFAKKMETIFHDDSWVDIERAHADADELMGFVLRDLGYYKGVEIFEAADKWYA